MWILFRLVLVTLAFIYKIAGKRVHRESFTEVVPGFPVFCRVWKPKYRRSRREIVFPIRLRCFFKLTPESRWSRFAKGLGYSSELQVGVPEFDDSFYIASDHQGFLRALREQPSLQKDLLELRAHQVHSIWSDGDGFLVLKQWIPTESRVDTKRKPNPGSEETVDPEFDLVVRVETNPELDPKLVQLLQAIQRSLDKLELQKNEGDRYLWLIYGLELVGLLLVSYGLGAFIEYEVDRSIQLLKAWKLAPVIGISQAVLLGLVFLFYTTLLKRSSRAPLLMAELSVLILAGGTIGMTQLVADLNRLLDKSEPRTTRALIVDKYERRRRLLNELKLYDKFLLLRFASNSEGIPEVLRVNHFDYLRVTMGQGAEIQIRQGFFGAPYIDKVLPIATPREIAQSNSVTAAINAFRARELAKWAAVPPSGLNIEWRERKYSSGAKREQEPFVNGKRNGLGRYWYESGRIYAEIPWVDDQKHGCFRLYRSDGTLEQIVSYQAGQPHGVQSWYDVSAKPSYHALYDRGVVQNIDPEFLAQLAKTSPCH